MLFRYPPPRRPYLHLDSRIVHHTWILCDRKSFGKLYMLRNVLDLLWIYCKVLLDLHFVRYFWSATICFVVEKLFTWWLKSATDEWVTSTPCKTIAQRPFFVRSRIRERVRRMTLALCDLIGGAALVHSMRRVSKRNRRRARFEGPIICRMRNGISLRMRTSPRARGLMHAREVYTYTIDIYLLKVRR